MYMALSSLEQPILMTQSPRSVLTKFVFCHQLHLSLEGVIMNIHYPWKLASWEAVRIVSVLLPNGM